MQAAKRYKLTKLGKRRKAIPGPEPTLNGKVIISVLGQKASAKKVKIGGKEIIPVSEPDLSKKAEEYVKEAVKSTWISCRGKFINKFEKSFAKKVGAKYAVAVNSGTSALHLAMAALGVKPQDEVVVPTFTMVSTAYAVSYMGAKPVFIDCDQYYQMDPKLIGAVINKKTKAILPVHIYGHPVDMDKIERIAKKHKLTVIYDAAEAHGAKYKGKPIGGRGLASCYSFYANKIITTGEGGMITTNNKGFADLCRNLKDVAFSTDRHFWHKRLGYNFRMTNVTAAIGLAQAERYESLVRAHIKNADYYIKHLSKVPGIELPKNQPWAKNVYWMFGIEVKKEFGMNRDQLRKYLAEKGIETRTYFVPMHLQPYYYADNKDKILPISERLSQQGMYLPSSSKLTKKQADKVIRTIKQAALIKS